MKPVVFIHTNEQQMIGAKLSEFSLKTRSKCVDKFDVKLLKLSDTPHLLKRESHTYLRKGKNAVWRNSDLQSFSPLRRMVPQTMQYTGRALVIDPDVFALTDVWELLNRDMSGKAIICRHMNSGYRNNGRKFFASSVMLLDCDKLTHWKWSEEIDEMFEKKLDYGPWISLLSEAEETIGVLEDEWNHMDLLNNETKFLHTTERSTQPWKTGLPVDFDTNWRKTKDKTLFINPNDNFLSRVFKNLAGSSETVEYYQPHPDVGQQKFIFELMLEALGAGAITEKFIQDEVNKKHVRADIFEVLKGYA